VASAFVLITAELDSETKVMKELKPIEEIKEAHMVLGVYDIIARIEADTMTALKDTISWKIRYVSNVRSTLTMIINWNHLGA